MAKILTNHCSLGRHPIFHDATVEEVDRAIGVLGESLVVRDHANGRTALVQFLEERHDGFAIA